MATVMVFSSLVQSSKYSKSSVKLLARDFLTLLSHTLSSQKVWMTGFLWSLN